MSTVERVRLLVGATVAALGLVLAGLTLTVPWQDPEFQLGPAIRVIMALTGAAILIIASRPGGSTSTTVRATTGVLGVSVIIYPSTLTLAAAGLGGPALQMLGWGGHFLPLVLVQALPVLASQIVTGRSRRLWLVLIAASTGASLIITSCYQLGMSVGWLLMINNMLWLGSFVLAPIATWTNVSGLSGTTRRKAIVAGLASVIPVVIISLCSALGAAAETGGLSADASVTALMAGFCLATSGLAVLSDAATGPEDVALLRRRPIIALLGVLLGAAVLLVAVGASLAALDAGLGPALVALVGIVVVGSVGLVAVRLFSWAARAVDPAAELAGEIAALGPVPDGEHRLVLQQALRRTSGDPGLQLWLRAADGCWIDTAADGGADVSDEPPSPATTLARAQGQPMAVAVSSLPGTPARLAAIGDCSVLARPAVLEATLLRESARADDAARRERERLSQNLHDGLQGRLLGLALNLQLSGRDVDDPNARLLVDQTVSSLRDAVEDVRALAGGRLPVTLAEHGLRPALDDLVRPLASIVELDVPDARLSAAVEAAGYFVISEALSNAVKHGGADHIQVRVRRSGATVSIMITDDGVGGADPRLGSGLRGLAERVEASGGVVVVRERAPHGTVVEASLPCGS